MSTKCLFSALKANVGNPYQKLLLVILSDVANEKRQCWPSHQYLMDRAECSRSSVIRHLQALEKKGLIAIENRSEGGIKTSNIYTILNVSERHNDVSERHGGSVTETHGGSVTETHNTPTSFKPPNEPIGVSEKPAPCPVSTIVELYHERLPTLPRVLKITPARRGNIRQRWREDLPALKNWENFFEYVSQSDFLMGRATPSRQGARPFVADLEWITKASNFAKIYEGKYHGV